MSTQTKKVSKDNPITEHIEVAKGTRLTKNEFSDFKAEELLEKGNMPPKQIKSLIDSFKLVVDSGLSEKEYENIWKKTFYRGSK